jgi:hypothetical protein
MRAFVCIAALAAAAALAPSAVAIKPLHGSTFLAQGGTVSCAYFSRAQVGRVLFRCDVRGGLKPAPKAKCAGYWTGAAMNLHGRAVPLCASDSAYSATAPLLSYGRTWTWNRLTCVSRKTGLTCRNRDNHGFVLTGNSSRFF